MCTKVSLWLFFSVRVVALEIVFRNVSYEAEPRRSKWFSGEFNTLLIFCILLLGRNFVHIDQY